MKQPYITIRRAKGTKMHYYFAFDGETNEDKRLLLQNCMEGMQDIFGRRAARLMAKKVFGLK